MVGGEGVDLNGFLARLESVNGNGEQYTARCPAHEDRRESLSVSVGTNGQILVHCFAGCEVEKVVQAMGLTIKDLWPEDAKKEKSAPATKAKGKTPINEPFKVGGRYYNKKTKVNEAITEVYNYCDEQNRAVLRVARTEQKSFPVCHEDGGTWYWGKGTYGHLVYRLPEILRAVREDKPIYLVEGEKDVQSLVKLGYEATCNLGGGGKGKWPGKASGYFRGARVYVLPDNDDPGREHARDVAGKLVGVAASVYLVELVGDMPELPDKGDVTDYLRAIGSRRAAVERFNKLIAGAQPFVAESGGEATGETEAERLYEGVYGYCVDKGRVCQMVEDVPRALCTFAAAPVEQIVLDDGQSSDVYLHIRGWARDGSSLDDITISSAEFAGMSWPLKYWGARGNIVPGATARDKLRYAMMESAARHAPFTRRYTHTGWRRVDGKWAYLHQGGAVGVDNASVALSSSLERYDLSVGREVPIKEAMGTCEALLTAFPLRVSAPLIGLMYLAPLREFLAQGGVPPSFTLYLLGNTGTRKSTIAALFLSHFGQFSRQTLPASFHDTSNAIRHKAFALKDSVLLIDDYHPVQSMIERRKMEEIAQTLSRAYGDGASRDRMTADMGQRKATPPRGLALITGEDMPAIGESGVARFYTIQIEREDIAVDNGVLTEMQKRAKGGHLARNMAGYIEWLLPKVDALPQMLADRFYGLQLEATRTLENAHGRAPETVAHLMLGIEMYLSYLRDGGQIDEGMYAFYRTEAWKVLAQDSAKQTKEARENRPSRMFVDIVRDLLLSENARVKGIKHVGGAPEDMIGYDDDDYYYFLPDMAYTMVCRVCQQQGTAFPLSKNMLYKQLKADGVLKCDSQGKATQATRIGGKVMRLLWMPKYIIDGTNKPVDDKREQLVMGAGEFVETDDKDMPFGGGGEDGV